MKRLKPAALALAACLLGATLAMPAHAQYRHGGRGGGHAHFGLSIGIPLFWPYWGGYPYPYYYYPQYPSQVVVVPSEPTVYVEQPRAQPAPEATGYWYYCASAGGYYPYVRECPGGWQRVAPRPPGE